MDYIKFITETLIEASSIARNNFGRVTSMVKSEDNNQVLTEADLFVGRAIIDKILTKYPNYNIIDEEAGVIDNSSNYTWIIDPIDGTSNFASGVPLYGVMLGLLKDDAPIAGGIALPSFSEVYLAEKGKGTFCNGKQCYVSKEMDLKNSLIAYGIDGHQESPDLTRKECELLSEIVLNVRNIRSSNSVFDLAMVAKGNYGAFLNRTSKVWDNVAQQIVIEEAGGVYTDFFGNKIDYSNTLNRPDANFTFLAGSPKLHEQLSNVIRNSNML